MPAKWTRPACTALTDVPTEVRTSIPRCPAPQGDAGATKRRLTWGFPGRGHGQSPFSTAGPSAAGSARAASGSTRDVDSSVIVHAIRTASPAAARRTRDVLEEWRAIRCRRRANIPSSSANSPTWSASHVGLGTIGRLPSAVDRRSSRGAKMRVHPVCRGDFACPYGLRTDRSMWLTHRRCETGHQGVGRQATR